MKNLLTALLPAMALLALGGCASTAGLATSEDDGVYYSSKDRTTAVVRAAPAPASTDEAANPDYNGSPAQSQANQSSGSSQYYDNTYTYMKGVPTSPGIGYYTPYSPYTTLSYAGGWGGGAYGFSPYAYGGGYDPFYSPYYSPFGYRSGLSVSFGFGYGRSYGYGGYSPFGYGYSPYGGYGYGGYGGFADPFYSPYYYGGPFYGGYYGRGGYYGNSYYGGGSNYGYGNNGSYDNRGNGRTSGHRTDRASEGRASAAGVSSGSTSAPLPVGGGRMRSEMVAQPGTAAPAEGVMGDRSRGRADVGAAPATPAQEQSTGGFNRPQRINRSGQPQFGAADQPTTVTSQPTLTPAQGQDVRDNGRGRWRNADANSQAGQPQPTAAPQPVENERRRGGFFRSMAVDQPATNGNSGQVTEQPQRRSYEQPRQQRTYEQPQQQQRSFEQPQQRSYEQPQRSYSQPSYSAPSGGGSGGGGGGGGGRRGRD